MENLIGIRPMDIHLFTMDPDSHLRYDDKNIIVAQIISQQEKLSLVLNRHLPACMY